MGAVNRQAPLAVVLRRKWVVIFTVIVVMATAAIVSVSLDKQYGASARLLVSIPHSTPGFDTVQAGQAVARSYSEIIDSTNIARLAAGRLAAQPGDIEKAMSFQQIPDTQLLEVSALARSPGRAKQIADIYALAFIDYADARLGRTTGADIKLADPATAPTSASRPRPTLYVLVAGLLALALGVALAFLRDRMDRRLRTARDVEESFDVPVIAQLPPRMRSATSIAAFEEASRVLRTNLQFAAGTKSVGAVAITSAGVGEGKTTTTAALAVAASEVGGRVVAVEGDLRRPALEKALFPDPHEPLEPGLTNYLIGAADLDETMHETTVPNLEVLPPGPLPPNPSRLLGSPRGEDLVQELVQIADLVVIDCPPLTVAADASIISKWVDGVIVVVDLGGSTDRGVRRAVKQLEAVDAPLLGFVLNRDTSASTSEYKYGYGAYEVIAEPPTAESSAGERSRS